MPMAAAEHFGTNGNGSPSKDYCCFCYQHGAFTDSFSLDEFIDDQLRQYGGVEKEEGCTVTNDEQALRSMLQLTQLKRWASAHQTTHQAYYQSVNRAVELIHSRLTEAISLADLARVANSSEFHFHRIFTAIMGERPGDYIRRLRLERAAFLLQTTPLPLAELAERTGYQSPHALSKAFKKRFDITPSAFRAQPTQLAAPISKPVENLHLSPEIREVAPKEVLYLRVVDPFGSPDAFAQAWRKLLRFANASGKPDDSWEYLCLTRDNSTITRPEHYRVYACMASPRLPKPSGLFGRQTIDGGLYAVCIHF